jgi:hypothetical protein
MATIEIDNTNWSTFFNSSHFATNTTYKLIGDIEINTNNHLILGDNSVFNGQNYKITINVPGDFEGLFKMAFVSNKVENLRVIVISGILSVIRGWIGFNDENFVNGTNGIVENCSVYWSNIRDGCGGIVGAYSNCTINNCYSVGRIGFSVGGIFGLGSSGTATNCYSVGSIDEYGGGIFGFGSSGTATNCYSVGSISRFGGGIFGWQSSGTATNCYSVNNIDRDGGGIFAWGSSGTAINCYSVGSIGSSGGGIFGFESSGTATNCYSVGSIGIFGGGIFGDPSSGIATNCYFFNNGTNSGDVGGSGSHVNSGWYAFTNPTDLPDTNWSPNHWLVDNSGIVADTTRYFPILKAFRSTPWNLTKYDNYDDQAKFIIVPKTLNSVTDWNNYTSQTNYSYILGDNLFFDNNFINPLSISNDNYFDGQDKSIILKNIQNFPGLFDLSHSNQETIIRNLKVKLSNSNLQDNNGFLGNGINSNGLIENCFIYLDNNILGNNCGGLVTSANQLTVNNCMVKGIIQGIDSGGLVGSNCANVTIYNSRVVGNVIDLTAGGLVGNNTTINDFQNSFFVGQYNNNNGLIASNVTINNSYNMYSVYTVDEE